MTNNPVTLEDLFTPCDTIDQFVEKLCSIPGCPQEKVVDFRPEDFEEENFIKKYDKNGYYEGRDFRKK